MPKLSRIERLSCLFALAWMAIVLAFFFEKHFPSDALGALAKVQFFIPTRQALGRHLAAFTIWLVLALGAVCMGEIILRPWNGAPRPATLVISAAMGLIALSLAVFFMGILQCYTKILFWILWFLLLALILFQRKNIYGSIKSALEEVRFALPPPHAWAVWTLALLIAVSFVMAFVPEIFYDSMVYHLGVPRWYLLEGGIKAHSIMHSNFPMLMQMLYLLGLALHGDTVAKLFHWFTGVLFVLTAVIWSREEKAGPAGLQGALLLLSMPMTMINWWTTGVDIALCLFAILAFWCWKKSCDKNSPASVDFWLVLSGVFSGAALSVKYTGILIVLLIGAFHFFSTLKSGKNARGALKGAALMGAAALIVAAPWLIKNWALTGNPVYPLLNSVFPSQLYDPSRFAHFWAENKGLTPENLKGWIKLPWLATFESLSELSYPGPLPLAILPCAAIFLVLRRFPASQRVLMFFSLLGIAAMFCFNRLTRYSLPFLSTGLLASSWIMARAYGRGPKLYRVLFQTGLILATFVNLLIGAKAIGLSYDPWRVLGGLESREDYQSHTRQGLILYPSTQMYAEAKKILPPGQRLLILGDERTSTCEVPFRAAGVFDTPLPVVWSQGSDNGETFYERVKRERIALILINPLEARRTMGYGIFDWPDETLAAFCHFWELHVRLVKETWVADEALGRRWPVFLYAVLPLNEAAQRPQAPNPVLMLLEGIKGGEGASWHRHLTQKFPHVAVFKQRLRALEPEGARQPAYLLKFFAS